jgi:hypothetical protein
MNTSVNFRNDLTRCIEAADLIPQPRIFASKLKDPESRLLPPEFRAYAKKTFSAIVARMHNREDGYSMEEISRGTHPFNRYFYKLVPTDSDILYGLGAFLLLTEEFAKESF